MDRWIQGTSRGIEASASLAILEKQAHHADTYAKAAVLIRAAARRLAVKP
jgi:hypothetical protein